MTISTIILIVAAIVGIVYVFNKTDKIKSNYIKKDVKVKYTPSVKNIKKNNILNEASTNMVWILNVGISLILISSIIFVTSTWENLTDVIKLLFLIIFTLSIFFLSNLCDRLKVRKSGQALWILGTIFLPIIIYMIGDNSLLGEYLSFTGKGNYLYLFLCSIICLPIFIYSIKRYEEKIYSYVSLITLTLSVVFLFKVFSACNTFIAFMLLVINSLVIYYLYKDKIKRNLQINNYTKILTYVINAFIIFETFSGGSIYDNIILLISYVVICINYYITKIRDEKDKISTLLIAISIFCFNITIVEIIRNINQVISPQVVLFLAAILEYILYYLSRNDKLFFKDLRISFGILTMLTLIFCSVTYFMYFNPNSLIPSLMLLVLCVVMMLERKEFVNENSSLKLEKILPYVLYSSGILLLPLVHETFIKINSNEIINSINYIVLIPISVVLYILGIYLDKKEEVLGSAFKNGGGILLIITFIMMLPVVSYLQLYTIIPTILAICVFLHITGKSNTEEKKFIFINSTIFSVLIFNIILCNNIINDMAMNIAMTLSLGEILLLNYIIKPSAMKRNIFATIILSILVTMYSHSESYVLLLVPVISLLILNKNTDNNKVLLLPSVILTLYSCINIIYKVLDITNLDSIILIIKLLILAATTVSSYSIFMTKEKKELKFNLLGTFIAYQGVMYSLFELFNTSIVFETILLTNGVIIFGLLYERITDNKRYNILAQIIFYGSLIIASASGNGNIIDLVLSISSIVICMILGYFLKDSKLLRGSLIGILVYAVFASIIIIRTIPWWAYLFILGILLVGLAIRNEAKKQK